MPELALRLSRMRGGSRGPWSPLALNPALWLSDTGSDAAEWPDLSGNGRPALQAAGSSQPAIVGAALNGRQVRRFDGVNDWLTIPNYGLNGLDEVTIFVVAQAATLIGYQSIVRSQNPGLAWFVYPWSSAALISSVDNNTATSVSPCFSAGAWGVGCARRTRNDASGLLAWLNGSMIGTPAATANSAIVAAAYIDIGTVAYAEIDFTEADIAEIIIFDRALTDPERQSVEAGLATKYAIAPPSPPTYLRPDGVSTYLRPDGVSTYQRP